MNTQHFKKTYGKQQRSKGSPEREVHSNTGLPKKNRNISNKQLNTTPTRTRGTTTKTDHMIGHKTSLNKFKKIEIISSIFADHKGLKLGTNLKENTQNHGD